MSDDRAEILKRIYRDYAADPSFAHLRAGGARVVPGRGNVTDPLLILVGEAPGEREQRERKPFVGPAGQILNEVLAHIGIRRDQVFCTNVVKYRPTVGVNRVKNRPPRPSEVFESTPYLQREIEAFGDGTVVVTLGNTPLSILGPTGWRSSMAAGHGWYDAHRLYVHWMHPAVAVYEPEKLDRLKRDAEELRSEVLHRPWS